MALVNYADEWLTAHNPVPASANIHRRIGGLLLISSLFSVIGVIGLWLVVANVRMAALPLALSLFSAIPLVFVWAMYFLLLNLFPVYQIVPLFQLTAIWLLLIELASGAHATVAGLAGVFMLVIGAYVLDVGKLKWVIPSKLFLIMLCVTFILATSQYVVRVAASLSSGAGAVSFWQYVGILGIGIALFLFVRPYREGFFIRIQRQGKSFVGISVC